KRALADLFAREAPAPGQTARLAAAAGAELTARGYHAQVQPQDDSLALFRIDTGRRAIRQQDGQFLIGEAAYPASVLLRELSKKPATLSPGVLLRPIVQDSLF